MAAARADDLLKYVCMYDQRMYVRAMKARVAYRTRQWREGIACSNMYVCMCDQHMYVRVIEARVAYRARQRREWICKTTVVSSRARHNVGSIRAFGRHLKHSNDVTSMNRDGRR